VSERELVPWSREWKDEQLFQVYEGWKGCLACPLSTTRTNVVFGTGNPDAKLLFIGEGPGEEEDSSGEPFCGVSGQLLRSLLQNAGIRWDDIYVTNLVGCRPTDDKGKNRDPSVLERDACMPRLHQIIYIVDPWIVVPVGKTSLKALARGRDWAITEHRGVVFSSPDVSVKLTGDRNGVEVPGHIFPRKDTEKREVHLEYDMIPILHPAYLLREDSYDEENKKFPSDGVTQRTFEDLKHIKKYLTALEKEYASVPRFERK
jgi:uracil-DNA glycosylase family 4